MSDDIFYFKLKKVLAIADIDKSPEVESINALLGPFNKNFRKPLKEYELSCLHEFQNGYCEKKNILNDKENYVRKEICNQLTEMNKIIEKTIKENNFNTSDDDDEVFYNDFYNFSCNDSEFSFSEKENSDYEEEDPEIDNIFNYSDDDKPVTQTVDTPVTPTVDTPVTPTVDKPTVDTPVTPTVDKPVKPTVDTPVTPTVDKPVTPTVDKPVKPSLTDKEKILLIACKKREKNLEKVKILVNIIQKEREYFKKELGSSKSVDKIPENVSIDKIKSKASRINRNALKCVKEIRLAAAIDESNENMEKLKLILKIMKSERKYIKNKLGKNNELVKDIPCKNIFKYIQENPETSNLLFLNALKKIKENK